MHQMCELYFRFAVFLHSICWLYLCIRIVAKVVSWWLHPNCRARVNANPPDRLHAQAG
jgi:hypothetical protein